MSSVFERRDIWIAWNENLTDKLKHYLPRFRNAIPNLTDVFLPEQATVDHRDMCREANFFAHTYGVAHSRTPEQFAKEVLARRAAQKTGAIDLNFEGGAISDTGLADYITKTIGQVRKTNPKLRVRINVVPWKGQFLPHGLINGDPNLVVGAQNYGGNMEELFGAEEIRENLVAWGITPAKAMVIHAVQCSYRPGLPRQTVIPNIRGAAGFYIDDLLLDAGLL